MKRVFSLSDRPHGGDTALLYKWQRKLGNYLATTGHDHVVRIWDRHGQAEDEIQLPAACTGLDWDCDGDALAAVCEKSSAIYIWDANQRKILTIDSGVKDSHTMALWSKQGLYLAIGSTKGNLIIYDHKVGRKIPILGKHAKKIICGAWSEQNKLALGSADSFITISDTSGQTIHQFAIRESPSLMQFSKMKSVGQSASNLQNTVSVVIGKKTLCLYNIDDLDNPIALAFQGKYGKIEDYQWYGDGYIMIGFSHGYLVSISTHAKEIGQEIFQLQNHHDYLSSIAVCSALSSAASCGDASIRIHNLDNPSDVTGIIDIQDETKGLKQISWTDDGQLLAVSSAKGNLHCYLTKLPMLGDSHGTKVAHLTSLLEVTLSDHIDEEMLMHVPIEVEPAFIACGPYHLAVGMNNRAWIYFIGDSGIERMKDREYLGTINQMKLNSDYTVVMFEGKAQLHMLDANSDMSNMEEREMKLFPARDDMGRVTSCDITNDYMLYSTDAGTLHFFSIEDWCEVNVFRHTTGIRNIFQDPSGANVAIIDDVGRGYIYSPVNDAMRDIPDFPQNCMGFLWEKYPFDKNVFVVYDESNVYTYVYYRDSLQGPHVTMVCSTHRPFTQRPLMLYNGHLTLQLPNGKLNKIVLDSHAFLKEQEISNNIDEELIETNMDCAIRLGRWSDAWDQAALINKRGVWQKLGVAAINAIQIEFAMRVYRCIKDAGMVLALVKLRDVEDVNLLSGMLASYIGDYDRAQDLLLRSNRPTAALDLRRDLLQWDTALQLAQKLDPTQIPFIAKEYAQQLEFTGNFASALAHYEKGITGLAEHESHDQVCAEGMTRMLLRQGDIRRGITQAQKIGSKQLLKECAGILENMKQLAESATMYESAECFEKAAIVYIRCKNWAKVGELLPRVASSRVHLQYAKAKEADGKYKEAAAAYKSAKDFDNEIRIYLDHLRMPEEAVRVVKETGSIDGANMVARFFIRMGDFGSAIQFLVLSKCNNEAFQLAQQHNAMEVYADIIGDDATADDFQSIAVHFENERNHLQAGRFYYKCGLYHKAMKHLMKSSDEKAIELAIQVATKSHDNEITNNLIGFLLGENDSNPRDPKYLFRLYMSLGRYQEAGSTATLISRDEQTQGNYRGAHDLLFSMMQELMKQNIRVPHEMRYSLMVLHSYMLAKSHIKRGDHLKAARMLIRVAENISKFPSHIVPILTSTVVECYKSGLHGSSFSYAAMLMRPEYRGEIAAKYKKKIEQIVRKSGNRTDEVEEVTTECPYCGYQLPETELVCTSCKSDIPYCIATGRHVTRTGLCACPSCDFPAIYSEFQKFLELEPTCPMCSEGVVVESLARTREPDKYLMKESEHETKEELK